VCWGARWAQALLLHGTSSFVWLLGWEVGGADIVIKADQQY
jgi:hypothetical protein